MLIPELDECESAPCQNGGTCTDEPVGYVCTFPNGFTGDECQFGM